MGKKYKETVKLTLFGRNDKLITDTTSIYSGYDRTLQTLTGGGVLSVNFTTGNFIAFTTAPNIYLSDASNKFNTSLISSLSTNYGKVRSVTVNVTPTNFTSAPTILFYGGAPVTNATGTAVLTGNSLTSITMTNYGVGYSSIPQIAWNGGGLMNITATMNGGNSIITSFTITTSPTFTTAPTILLYDGTNAITTTCTITTNAITSVTLPTFYNFVGPVTVYIVSGTGVGASLLTLTPNMGQSLNSVILPTTPYGAFIAAPTLSFNGGGVINITTTIILSDGSNYTTTTSTITNGIITAIATPAVNNNFTSTPVVSVSSPSLATITTTLNPFKYNIGDFSPYKNMKLLRFELNQELQSLRLAENAEIF